jgi:hypothetical protein
MMFTMRSTFAIGILMMLTTLSPQTATADDSALTLIGQVRPRTSAEIGGSNWSVGVETLDREYAVYEHLKPYLAPLGVKHARVQSGWARTETQPGVYDWQWLDAVIPDMTSRGVKPWVSLSYGNPIYTGGGTNQASSPLPTGAARDAWLRFVGAFVERYKGQVDEWEVWNEPAHQNISAADYAAFLAQTASAVRARQADGKILAFAHSGTNAAYTDQVLALMRDRNELHLVDQVTYHPYSLNPDAIYTGKDHTNSSVALLRQTIAKYSDRITIRQGENGAPSQRSIAALGNYDWTETSQAKWALRRLLGDLGRDIPSSYFALADLHYDAGINHKGLLHTNADKTVAGEKASYRAVQHLTSLFDDSLARIDGFAWQSNTSKSLSVFGYESAEGLQAVTIWQDGATPSSTNNKTLTTFTFAAGAFEDPVYVDLLDGRVFDIGAGRWSRSGSAFTFLDLPIYDSPIVLTDRSLVHLVPEPAHATLLGAGALLLLRRRAGRP